MRNRVAKILAEIGAGPELEGFKFWCDAVEIISGNEKIGCDYLIRMIAGINRTNAINVYICLQKFVYFVEENNLHEFKKRFKTTNVLNAIKNFIKSMEEK